MRVGHGRLRLVRPRGDRILSPMVCTNRASTSRSGISAPTSRSSEVTPRSSIPQGTINRKNSRSVLTLKAKPWLVTQREMRTPMAPIFSAAPELPGPCRPIRWIRRPRRPTRDPGAREAGNAPGGDAVAGAHADHHLFEVAHVAVDVAPVGIEVDDRIPDDLPGPVVGHVAAAAGLGDLDAERAAASSSGARMCDRPPSPFTPEREHVRMLQQEQRVGNRRRPCAARPARAAAPAPRRRAPTPRRRTSSFAQSSCGWPTPDSPLHLSAWPRSRVIPSRQSLDRAWRRTPRGTP